MAKVTWDIDIASMQAVRVVAMREQIKLLHPQEQEVLALLYGVGCRSIPVAEAAERLGLTTECVWAVHEAAVLALGTRVAMECAA